MEIKMQVRALLLFIATLIQQLLVALQKQPLHRRIRRHEIEREDLAVVKSLPQVIKVQLKRRNCCFQRPTDLNCFDARLLPEEGHRAADLDMTEDLCC